MGKHRRVLTIWETPEEGLMTTQLGATPPWAHIRERESKSSSPKTNTVASQLCGGGGDISHFLPHTVYSHPGSLSTKSEEKKYNSNNNVARVALFPLCLAASSRHRQCGSLVSPGSVGQGLGLLSRPPSIMLARVEGVGERPATEMPPQYP